MDLSLCINNDKCIIVMSITNEEEEMQCFPRYAASRRAMSPEVEEEEERSEEPIINIPSLKSEHQQQEDDGFVVTHELQPEHAEKGTPEPLGGASCPKTQVVISSLKRHYSAHMETGNAAKEPEQVVAAATKKAELAEEVIVEDNLNEEETLEMEKVDSEYGSDDDYSQAADHFSCSHSDDENHIIQELAAAAARFGLDSDDDEVGEIAPSQINIPTVPDSEDEDVEDEDVEDEDVEDDAPEVNASLDQDVDVDIDDHEEEISPKRPTCKSLIFRFIPNAENKGEFEVKDVFVPNELYPDEVDCVIVEVTHLAQTTSEEDYNYAALLEQFLGETPVVGLVAGIIVQSTHKEWQIGDMFKAELPFIIEQRVDDVSEFVPLYGGSVQEALVGHGTFVPVEDWKQVFVPSQSRSSSVVSLASEEEETKEEE